MKKILIKEDTKLPDTNIILEKGDAILVKSLREDDFEMTPLDDESKTPQEIKDAIKKLLTVRRFRLITGHYKYHDTVIGDFQEIGPFKIKVVGLTLRFIKMGKSVYNFNIRKLSEVFYSATTSAAILVLKNTSTVSLFWE